MPKKISPDKLANADNDWPKNKTLKFVKISCPWKISYSETAGVKNAIADSRKG